MSHQHALENWSIEQWRLYRWAGCRLTERVDREIGQVLQALKFVQRRKAAGYGDTKKESKTK